MHKSASSGCAIFCLHRGTLTSQNNACAHEMQGCPYVEVAKKCLSLHKWSVSPPEDGCGHIHAAAGSQAGAEVGVGVYIGVLGEVGQLRGFP